MSARTKARKRALDLRLALRIIAETLIDPPCSFEQTRLHVGLPVEQLGTCNATSKQVARCDRISSGFVRRIGREEIEQERCHCLGLA